MTHGRSSFLAERNLKTTDVRAVAFVYGYMAGIDAERERRIADIEAHFGKVDAAKERQKG